MKKGQIISEFLNQKKYIHIENGNIVLVDIVKYLKPILNTNRNEIIYEVKKYLHKKNSKDFLFAADLIGELNLTELVLDLIKIKNDIIIGQRQYIPFYFLEFIEINLKKLTR